MTIQLAHKRVLAFIRGSSPAALEIDYMEYATDGAAQSAYVTSATAYTGQFPTAQSTTYVKATTYNSAATPPWAATDPTASLTGSDTDTNWLSDDEITNQRFHIDLGSSKIINRVYYENSHDSGNSTTNGVQNFTLWGSDNAAAFAELTYATDTNWTQITGLSQSTFDQHTASNVADPKYITFTNSTAYRYYAFKFADNYGGVQFQGVRHIELQTTALNSFSESTIKTQGDYALKLSATTDSLNETVTKTLTGGDILDLTGKNTIKLDARSTGTGSNLEFNIRNEYSDETTLDIFSDSSCKALYLFNNDATDESGNNDATPTDITYTDGVYNQCAVFNGSTSTTQESTLQAFTDFTISMWFKPNAEIESLISTEHVPPYTFSIGMNNTTGNYKLQCYAGIVGAGATYAELTTNDYTIDAWNFVTISYDYSSGSIKTIMNGVKTEISGQASVAWTNGQYTRIGSFNGSHFFNGEIDQVRYFDKIISDAESATLYKDPFTTHTIDITSADTYQTDSWDISGVADADKDAIDQIQAKVVDTGPTMDTCTLNGTDEYLTQTPGSGNQKLWTFSAWVYSTDFSTITDVFNAIDGTNHDDVYWHTTGKFTWEMNSSGVAKGNVTTDNAFNTTSTWYHITLVYDSANATSADRMKIYVNAADQALTTSITPVQNAEPGFNSAALHGIGAYNSGLIPMTGAIADIYFIDGYALTPASFTETKGGVLIPKTFSGTYGTNGFHVDFAASGDMGNDVSGNANDWTLNGIDSGNQGSDTFSFALDYYLDNIYAE
jgi:hypothetical protein